MTNVHHNNVSIAYAVVNVAGAMNLADRRLAVGILSHAPGDGTITIAREIAKGLNMELLDIRMGQIEYHPGALDNVIAEPFERALSTGRAVMIVLDEAHAAAPGVVEATMSIIAKRIENQPCAVLATSLASREKMVAIQMAAGLDCSRDRIVMHRTANENARIVEKFLQANGPVSAEE